MPVPESIQMLYPTILKALEERDEQMMELARGMLWMASREFDLPMTRFSEQAMARRRAIELAANEEHHQARLNARRQLDQDLQPIYALQHTISSPGTTHDTKISRQRSTAMWQAHRRYNIRMEKADAVLAAAYKRAHEELIGSYVAPEQEQQTLWEARA